MCNSRKQNRKFYLHQAMAFYGVENFKVIPIATVQAKLADRFETMFIESYGTMMPSGYNMCEGGSGRAMLNRINVEKMHQTRFSSKGLPMNISYRKVNNNEGYIVQKVGYGNSKAFTSMKYTMQEKLDMAKAYLATLTQRVPSTKRTLPKHVQKAKGRDSKQGLRVEVKKKGKSVFTQSWTLGTFEEQLAHANVCLARLREEGMIK